MVSSRAPRVTVLIDRWRAQLECDVAPLVGPDSVFAASFAAAGLARAEQLARLLGEYEPKWRAGKGS